MWRKEGTPEPEPVARMEPTAPERSVVSAAAKARATIGPSITIKGEVSGDEDLLIQGRVEGTVTLKQHTVTVGREGKIKANIVARLVTIEGSVEGDLSAEEQVILRGSARVQGDIKAPRVVLEDGARFRGGVDMGEPAEGGARSAAVTPSRPAAAPRAEANALGVAQGELGAR